MERRIRGDERSTRAAIAEARGFRSVEDMHAHYEQRGTYPSGAPVQRDDDAQLCADLEAAIKMLGGVA
jgi:hypothetical protein